jgi:uncharacterized protein YndB with AHSA1/START domain
MAVKNDGNKRWVELEFVVPGTPEQVWKAMATGPGNSSWFTVASIEEQVGGSLSFNFGGGVASSGTVTEWQPPHRFGYEERGWSEGAPPLATEIIITSRSGDTCHVRMVHSLFSSADQWDDQMEGFETGWPGFIEILRIYLANYAGQPAASLRKMTSFAGTQAEAWKILTDKLNLVGADVGDRRTLALGATLRGVVHHVHQTKALREVTLQLDEPCPGVGCFGTHSWGDQTNASVSIFFYGENAAATAAAQSPIWDTWVQDTFRSPKERLSA